MNLLALLILICSVRAKEWEYEAKLSHGTLKEQQESGSSYNHFNPDWRDLDKRQLPRWYDRAKVGIFIHWGVYSVPSYGSESSEWFWHQWVDNKRDVTTFMAKNYRPGFTYQDFAPMFTAEFFDPQQWARFFKLSGARYVVLTAKHHDGFALFPSRQSFGWNSVDVGPNFDIVEVLSRAVRREGLEFGLYHSLYEWFNPLYLQDKEAEFKTNKYCENKMWPDFLQLVNTYKPSIIWSDGDWENTDTYWNSTNLLAWLYNESPVKDKVVVNDRWGKATQCQHGDFFNCEDRYDPKILQKHKWESAFSIDKSSWGYRRNMHLNDILTIPELIGTVVRVVSCGGNVLINIGPTKEGTIPLIFQETLLALGEWLDLNGEAIYATSPWQFQNDTLNSHAWYTCTRTEYDSKHPPSVPQKQGTIKDIYAIFLKWPRNNILNLKAIASDLHSGNYQIELLDQRGNYLDWKITEGVANIQLPNKSTILSSYAWTLKFSLKESPKP